MIINLKVAREDIPESGKTIQFVATQEQCKQLCKDNYLQNVSACRVELLLTPKGKHDLLLTGLLKAQVTYRCVLTLDNFDADITQDISVTFSDRPPLQNVNEDEIDLDVTPEMPEPLQNGLADLGSVLEEFFALALDPYPKKPGAVFQDIVEPVINPKLLELAKLAQKNKNP